MKKLSKLIAVLFCCVLVVGTASSCFGVTVTSISLSSKALTFLVGGESKTITAIVEPKDVKDDDLIWSIEPEGFATLGTPSELSVDITPVKAGTATITVSAKNDPEVKATCTVTVKDPVVTGLSLNKSSLTLAHIFNATETLTATVNADEGADKTVTWTSEDPLIASVSSSGVVTAVGSGSTVITATSGEKSATCEVSVKVPLEIRTPAEFIAIGTNADTRDGYYFLGNDIDFAGYDYNGSANGTGLFTPLAPVDQGNGAIGVGFTGTLDGRGFALKNLNIGQTGSSNAARTSIIGNIAASGVVKNLEIIDFTYTTPGYRSGILANYIFGTVENINLVGTATFSTGVSSATSWDRCGAIAAGIRAGGVMRNVVAKIDTSASNNYGIYAATSIQQQGAAAENPGADAKIENVFVVLDKAKTTTLTMTEVAAGSSTVVRVNAEGALVATAAAASGDIMIGVDQTSGHATAPNNLAKGVKGFKESAIGSVDFSKLPAADWTGNAASGATALPTLKDNKATAVAVTSIESSNVTLPVGVSYSITPVAKPANASYQKFNYTVQSGKESVATWNDATKTLTTVGAGTIAVTIKWAGNESVTGTCTITVDANMKVNPEGVTLSKKTLSLWQGMAAESTNWDSFGGTATLTAKVTSKYDSGDTLKAPQDVVWSSSDPTVATVSSTGLVTSLKKGTAVIKATAKDTTVADECTVTVSEPTAISTAEQFKAALQPASWNETTRAALSGVYFLTADIDFGGATLNPIGDQEHNNAGHVANTHNANCDVLNGWRGIFNGKGHALKNFVIGGTAYNSTLFPGLYGGVLRNFSLIGVKTADTGLNRASILVNSVYGGRMENIYIEGEIRSQAAAGDTATYAYGGTVFGGTGDNSNTLISSSNPQLTIRNIVTKVTATGTSNNRTYRVAGRIGNGLTDTNAVFSNFFVVTDGLTATGNLNGNSSVSLAGNKVTAFAMSAVGTTSFAALSTDDWVLTAGALPTLKVLA